MRFRSRRIVYYPHIRGSWTVVVHEYRVPGGWVAIHTMDREGKLWCSDRFPGLKSLFEWRAFSQEWLKSTLPEPAGVK